MHCLDDPCYCSGLGNFFGRLYKSLVWCCYHVFCYRVTFLDICLICAPCRYCCCSCCCFYCCYCFWRRCCQYGNVYGQASNMFMLFLQRPGRGRTESNSFLPFFSNLTQLLSTLSEGIFHRTDRMSDVARRPLLVFGRADAADFFFLSFVRSFFLSFFFFLFSSFRL